MKKEKIYNNWNIARGFDIKRNVEKGEQINLEKKLLGACGVQVGGGGNIASPNIASPMSWGCRYGSSITLPHTLCPAIVSYPPMHY